MGYHQHYVKSSCSRNQKNPPAQHRSISQPIQKKKIAYTTTAPKVYLHRRSIINPPFHHPTPAPGPPSSSLPSVPSPSQPSPPQTPSRSASPASRATPATRPIPPPPSAAYKPIRISTPATPLSCPSLCRLRPRGCLCGFRPRDLGANGRSGGGSFRVFGGWMSRLRFGRLGCVGGRGRRESQGWWRIWQ